MSRAQCAGSFFNPEEQGADDSRANASEQEQINENKY